METIEISRAVFIGSPKCSKATPLSTLAKPGKYGYFADYVVLEDGIERVRSLYIIHEEYVNNADFWNKSSYKARIGYHMINNLTSTADSIGIYDLETSVKNAKSWERMVDIIDFSHEEDVKLVTRTDEKDVVRGVEMLCGTSIGKKSIFIIADSCNTKEPAEDNTQSVSVMPPIIAAQIFAFDIYDKDEYDTWVGSQDLLLCDIIKIGV